MPEGPEIRRAADRIAKAIAGQRLAEVRFGLPRLRRFEDELTGVRVAGVETRGKALLIAFDQGLTLYSHNQLYGVWYLRRRGQLPNTAIRDAVQVPPIVGVIFFRGRGDYTYYDIFANCTLE